MSKKRNNSVEMNSTNRRTRFEDDNDLDDGSNETTPRSSRSILSLFLRTLLKILNMLFIIIGKSKHGQSSKANKAYNETSRETDSNIPTVTTKQKQTASNRDLTASLNKTPTSSNSTPTTSNKTPTTSKKTPTSSNSTPTSSNKTPTTSNKTPTTSNKTPTSANKTQKRTPSGNSNVHIPTSAIEQNDNDTLNQIKEKINLAFTRGKKRNFPDVRFLIGDKTRDYTPILQFFDGPTEFEEDTVTGRKGKLYTYE
jgi:DNA mismatch repair ATPase MutL